MPLRRDMKLGWIIALVMLGSSQAAADDGDLWVAEYACAREIVARMLDGKTRLISARLPRRLVNAKRRTDIRSDTKLLVFALVATAALNR